jgi:F420H(2)-dependent biliverdin reductase
MITESALAFLAERHLGVLSTRGKNDRIHAVPVGFTWHEGVVRIIGSRGTQKFVNAQRSGRATITSVDGARWISFEGEARVSADAEAVDLAVDLYAARYRPPRVNPERVVLEVRPDRVLGSAQFRA